ncbi:MAG: DHHA1 domain-containing protein [Vicinamibacterales bacterium]
MTERIYYNDPYARSFDARVVHVRTVAGRTTVTLDRTAFYPSSGGQPFDTGTLNTARVVEVVEDEDGQMQHVIDGSLSEGESVSGAIDWDRRFDHMQQHTGQHMLSAAFDRLLKVRTESFHLGTASATIDLAREVSPAEIARAEKDANTVIWDDRPVVIRYADADEAAKLPLRKDSTREGVLRLIDIEGYDISACGGTHVSRTGAIATIAVASWEKFRGGSRIAFVCGGRALTAFHELRDATAAIVRLLSVLPEEMPGAIERTQAELKDARRRIKDLQSQLASHEARSLADGESGSRAVVRALEGWDQNGLKSIAMAIAEREGYTAVLIGLPPPSAIVVARGTGSPHDASAVLRQLTARFGGKGGGRPELAQGGGLQGDLQEMLAYAKTLLV